MYTVLALRRQIQRTEFKTTTNKFLLFLCDVFIAYFNTYLLTLPRRRSTITLHITTLQNYILRHTHIHDDNI